MGEEDVVVSICDEGGDLRRLSEYKPTNVPLSKSEIHRDEARDTAQEGWAPRTTENIGDMVPLPEQPNPSSDID